MGLVGARLGGRARHVSVSRYNDSIKRRPIQEIVMVSGSSNPSDSKVPDTASVQAAAKAAAVEWEKRTNLWSSMVPEHGMELPKGFDINDPEFRKNVKVEIGPPMTAEEFHAWQNKRRHMSK
jgi:hypothetical protein